MPSAVKDRIAADVQVKVPKQYNISHIVLSNVIASVLTRETVFVPRRIMMLSHRVVLAALDFRKQFADSLFFR
jgi:hypothetical protein